MLFPHLVQNSRGAWSGRRYLLAVPVAAIAGVVAFVYLGGLDYRPFHLGSLYTPAAPEQTPPWLLPIDASPIEQHHSPYSFDINGAPAADRYRAWMAAAPDALPLARLSIPGTHDTMTHNVSLLGYRCQNADLRTQLLGGVRYLDIRARLQVDGSDDKDTVRPTDALGIYHGHVYTGYTLGDVLQTVADFLDAHPSEAIVLRLKEEGPPLKGSARDAPGRARDGADDVDPPSSSGSPFLDAFQHYMDTDVRLQTHLFSGDRAPDAIPTVGAVRGKILLLQEFPYFPARMAYTVEPRVVPVFGIPWYLASDLLAVEDKWQMRDLADLDAKWDAVKANLDAAQTTTDKLYLSHLSASVGVLPIDAAAGPINRSTVGINDRTGEFLSKTLAAAGTAPIGIVMADFPGQQLMRAIIERNEHVAVEETQ